MNYLTFIICLCATVGLTQNTISINGKLVNENKQPIANATVLLNQPATNFSKFALSDSLGNFKFEDLKDTIYTLSIFDDRYERFSLEIQPTGNNQDLKNLVLFPKAIDLNTVTVKAEKPIIQVKADKTIFNVGEDISTQGKTAWELLQQSPGVTVDNAGTILLEGKSGTQVYVDDKPLYLSGVELKSYLMSIQASAIDNIELISQPSAKYEAEGSGGIINIVQKRSNDKGINGALSNTVTYGKKLRNNTSLTLNYRNNKSSLYGSLNNRIGENYGFINLDRTIGNNRFDAETVSISNRFNNSAKLGYDYTLSDKVTIGLLAKGVLNDSRSLAETETRIGATEAEMLDSLLVSSNQSTSNFESYAFNLNYVFEDTNGHSLNIDADHGQYSSNTISYQPNFYFNPNQTETFSQFISTQESPTVITITSFKADYEQNLWNGKLGLGTKYSHVRTTNDFNFYTVENDSSIKDLTRSNEFDYLEQIIAAYGRYEKSWKKWSIELGLRLEQTNSTGELTQAVAGEDDLVKRSYLNFFPSGGLTYSPNRKHTFSFRGNRRISRPNYTSLNPFESRIDALSYTKGNPFLQPQYIQSYKIAHRFNYKMNTAISYSRVTDFFAQVTDADGQSRNFMTVRNIADENILNISFSYPGSVTKWWTYYLSINASNRSYVSKDPKFLSQSRNALMLYAQNTLKLKAGVTAQVSGWYMSPSIWGGTYRTKSMGALNISFSKAFLKERLNASVSFNDVLFTSYWSGVSEFGNLYLIGSGGGDSRNVAVSLSYNFGNAELKRKRERETSAEAEENRAR